MNAPDSEDGDVRSSPPTVDDAEPARGVDEDAGHESRPGLVSRRIRHDLGLAIAVAVGTFALSAAVELNESLIEWTRPLEPYQLDELPYALLAIAFAFAWFWWRRSREAERELSRRAEIQQELDRSRRQYRRLSHRSMAIQESERRSLARELHDEMGQVLNAIKIDAVTIRDHTPADRPDLQSHARSIVEMVDHVYGVVRQMMGRLRPTALDELGLVAAIQHLVDMWRQRLPAVTIDLEVDGEVDAATEDVNIALFRTVQECLTNAARHAEAHRIRIVLTRSGAERVIRLTVIDDGRGFDPQQRAGGLGLVGMRERIAAVDGWLRVRSAPGGGTRIEVRVEDPETRPVASATERQ